MILLLDNYDSFVHNLARYFRIAGCQTTIRRSDEIDAERCFAMHPTAIVISPGPKRPEAAGCSIDVIRRVPESIPLLGVCLGHQAIGVAFGGQVIPCEPMHGMSSSITHDGNDLFQGCTSPMDVGRYHSLAIDPKSLPHALQVTACGENGMIMAVRHRQRPIYGVQFHPESVLTPLGQQVVHNFANIATSDRSSNHALVDGKSCP